MPVPVPRKVALCGLVGSLSNKLTEPLARPTTVGLNDTLMMQVAFAARTLPLVQVVPDALTNGAVTVTAGVLRVTFPAVLFVTVILAEALVRPDRTRAV